ncbi:SRPBCC family protein [Saccharothrix sp. BKS2]|uniref:SRPBCC family protein n=1 Tax=Saccharothrix sp. BKS2 TaxID=3064400 RepID=UPI0039ED369D
MEVSTRAPGRAPAEVVWERYAHIHRWPEWAPQITGVEPSAPRLAPGVTGRVRGPLGVRVRFTVTEVDDAARTWAWLARVGPLRLALRHGVEPDGSTWLTVRGPAPVVLPYLPVAHIALRCLTRP